MVWIELGCTCHKRNDTYSMCEWWKLRSACAFYTSPALHSHFLWFILFTLNVNLWKVWPNKTLVSLCIIAVSMVHLYSKSLASPERSCVKRSNQNCLRIPYWSLWRSSGSSVGLALACWPSCPRFVPLAAICSTVTNLSWYQSPIVLYDWNTLDKDAKLR